MSLVLGIDTGGTYTDGVVLRRETREVIATAKSLTTREDLALGIAGCLDNLDFSDYDQIDFVTLSTTLATNAIVEGRGCRVGLLLLGFDSVPDLPLSEIRLLPGGHNIRGEAKVPLDETAIRTALESLRGKVEALAISSYLSIRNPEHEIRVLTMAREILDIPAVCAHQLTRSLGVKERTVTAVLNARLIPVIDELIVSVKKVLALKNVKAPILIVKGDGALMAEEQARIKPIETILSGPAASIIGANYLAGQKDALILDMGGTTTDIAVLRNGRPRLGKEGARVGGWLTRVEAAEINTFGLGGDSYVQLNIEGFFQLGPQRVVPISLLVARYPYLMRELSAIHIPRSHTILYSQVTDCFILLDPRDSLLETDLERRIVGLLRKEPHSLFYLADRLGVSVNLLDICSLVDRGILGRSSVTPTDILMVKGLYDQWDKEAAELAVTLLGKRFGMEMREFADYVMEKVVERLCYTVWQSLMDQEGVHFDLDKEPVFEYLARKHIRPKKSDFLDSRITLRIPVIGVGAPVGIWLPLMSKVLGSELILPEFARVANAVGAAAGRVMETVKLLIAPAEGGMGYILYSTWERREFEELDEAVEYGRKFAAEQAFNQAKANGVENPEVTVEYRHVYANSNGIENDIYIETHIQAIGTSRGEWEYE